MIPLHASRPCATCPFLCSPEVPGAFEPATLDATVGENLRAGRFVHRCHKTLGSKRENLCVGFLRFIRDQGIANELTTLGEAIGVIDYAQIKSDPPILTSWKAVLEEHGARLGRSS